MFARVAIIALLVYCVASQAAAFGNNELKQAIDASIQTYVSSGQWATDFTSIYGPGHTVTIKDECTTYPTYPATPSANGGLARVISRGSLNIAYQTSLPAGSATFGGFDGLLASYIVKQLSTKYGKTITANFNVSSVTADHFTKLTSGNVDIIMAGLARTPAREPLYQFSCSYASTVQSLVSGPRLLNGATLAPTLTAFNTSNALLGVISAGASETLATSLFLRSTIVKYSNHDQMFDALVNGTIHGYIFGKGTIEYKTNQYRIATPAQQRVNISAATSVDTVFPLNVILNKDTASPPASSASIVFHTLSVFLFCLFCLLL